MNHHMKKEFIVNGIFVVTLILVKVFVYLPTQTDFDFHVGWFIVLSFLTIPVIRLLTTLSILLTRFAYSENWKTLQETLNTIFGIPLTIVCLLCSIYLLGQPLSVTSVSILFVTLPVIAFSQYISIIERS